MYSFAPKMTRTPDAQLATPLAIKNRIAEVEFDKPWNLKARVAALRARLPQSERIVVLDTPQRFNAAQLASKTDREAGYSNRYVGA